MPVVVPKLNLEVAQTGELDRRRSLVLILQIPLAIANDACDFVNRRSRDISAELSRKKRSEFILTRGKFRRDRVKNARLTF